MVDKYHNRGNIIPQNIWEDRLLTGDEIDQLWEGFVKDLESGRYDWEDSSSSTFYNEDK